MKMRYVSINGDVATVNVQGRFDLLHTAEVMPEIEQAFGMGVTKVHVDFSGTTYIDSSAIRDLGKLYRRVKAANFSADHATGDVYAALYAAKLDTLWNLESPNE